MEIEMREVCGFVHNFCNQLDDSKKFYEKAMKKAEETGDERALQLSLCNIGVIEGEKGFDEFLEDINKEQEDN